MSNTEIIAVLESLRLPEKPAQSDKPAAEANVAIDMTEIQNDPMLYDDHIPFAIYDSNGETAMRYFEEKLRNDTLYCLDEPENSMSPRLQQELVKLIGTMARYCGCQFFIATHSPFLLALRGARVYDLDRAPVETRKWTELENVQVYRAFFAAVEEAEKG